MNIFSELEKLNFPKDDFMVLGSGILGALGIREIGDIDLLIKPELFEKLRNSGWAYEIIKIESLGNQSREMVSKDNIQVFKDFWFDGKILPPEEGFKRIQKINGINFISLDTLLEYKKKSTREKDIKDVALIEEYLKSN